MTRVLLLTALAMASIRPAVAGETPLHVPQGFSVERVAGPSTIQFPMFATLDDAGRLYVTESSGGDLYAELQRKARTCRIRLLEDRDGDGRFETGRVFAEHLTPSMGLVWSREAGGKLFAADPPDLVTLEDTDGDGQADKRTVVLTGFGHTDNGSLHGLTFGPDGWLYMTMGSPDGYDLHGPDGSHASGTSGALLRCRSDGSGVETVARGFENLVEVVFLPDGSIVGTLNWYKLPEQGTRDALVQVLEGSLYVLRPVGDVPYLQSNITLPPLALFGAVAHSGLQLYEGTLFPPEMRGDLFSAEHNARKIVGHRLTPNRASYAVESFDFVTTDDPDVHFSDVLQDLDGSLLLLDTGSWYVQHCPTGRIRQAPARGGVYRVTWGRRSDQAKARRTANRPARASTWTHADLQRALAGTNDVAIAAAARAAGRHGETNAGPQLIGLLRSPNLQLRLAAAQALADCGDASAVPALVEALAADTDAFLRHALIFALHHRADTAALLRALDHSSARVQSAALLLLDQAPFQAAPEEAVLARLNATNPDSRSTARWVLARHPDWSQAGRAFLLRLLEQADTTEADRAALDRFLSLFQGSAEVIAALANALARGTETQRLRVLEALSALDMREVPRPLAEAIVPMLERGDLSVRSAAIRACAALRIRAAQAPLSRIARDPSQPDALRGQALRAIVRGRPVLEPTEMEFLLRQLAATNPPTARLAAAETLALARLDPSQWVAFLNAARGDALISPSSIVDAVERDHLPSEAAVAFLDYLAASIEAGWTISADRLVKVQADLPDLQRVRAKELLARLSENIQRQRQQLAEFEPLLEGGDFVRGERVFFDKAQCVACHTVWGNGGHVGPDLTGIGKIRTGRDLLEAILVPSASLAQGYDTLLVTTKDDESYTGVRVGRGEEPLVLRLASGAELTLHPDQIGQIHRSKLSLMPEGLLNHLTRDEVRDLLGYLQHLK